MLTRARFWLAQGGLVLTVGLWGCGVGELHTPSGPASTRDGAQQAGALGGAGPVGSPSTGQAAPRFACGSQAAPIAQPLRRLSGAQYDNTLRAVLTERVGAERAASALAAAAAPRSQLPADVVTDEAPFARMDQGVSQSHAENAFRVAEQLAAALTDSAEARADLLGACAGAPAEADACVDALIADLGALVTRRPLTGDDRAFYRDVYGASGALSVAGLRDVLTVMLSAPRMLYHVELGAGPSETTPGAYELDAYELAARVSYHFWQAPPDAQLRVAAESGALLTEEGYRDEVQRVFADPRTATSLEQFAHQWLHLEALRPPHLSNGDPVYDAFVGPDAPSDGLGDAMVQELTDSFSQLVLGAAGSFQDWFTSQQSYARTEELARLYGVEVWDGESEPPYFPEGERAGLLTRAALLATGSANTRPVMKGVFIRRRLLCDSIAPPPDNAAADPPEPSAERTTRQVVQDLTEQPGTNCAGCHTSQINGLGYATEGYDALGRVRTVQQLFDEGGAPSAALPVNTRSVPQVFVGDLTEATGPQDLAALILQSGKAEACFARQYFRFTYGRLEDMSMDGCTLEAIRQGLVQGDSLAEVMRSVALRPEMRLRAAGGE